MRAHFSNDPVLVGILESSKRCSKPMRKEQRKRK
nr:MAG TPA: hypothetical protein [Caudoviricetes sp.]